ncbi:serine/threonine protein kinase [Aliidiomarina iranensis]|uniref:Serine/threonine protein kinase n=1 Tax=Aliidiomarina iranensis TaxID=1434071 RepID=A0A432VV35_9GAMM|nr:phosphotransferase [Aliidiomarina iranensis]RUO20394.1 serine/threonine protein kinase [Aliidiomarina iranensis]
MVLLADWAAKQLSLHLKQDLAAAQLNINILAGDASFRRYFRITFASPVQLNAQSFVLVDAPPPESLEPFVSIALAYQDAHVRVPNVLSQDADIGVMLLEDFGDELFYQRVTKSEYPQVYYQQALQQLPALMRITEHRSGVLPEYDQALLQRENALFSDWLVGTHLGLTLSLDEQKIWQQFSNRLIANALQQPQVGVHRDYHSRNLMFLGNGHQVRLNQSQALQHALGIIDFQDAVRGPITYDLVSLLRDCYIVWPDTMVQELSTFGYELLQQEGLLAASVSVEEWQQWFDLMGLQRHTKASGIFARLYHRDGKAGYLHDIPATVEYLLKVAQKYPEFRDYCDWLQERIIPALAAKAENSVTGLKGNS